MKLIKKNTNASTFNLENVEIKSYLIKYIQSYLKWLVIQNPRFVKSLKNEELSNFLLQNISLPTWFAYLLETNSFKILCEVNNYIAKYKKNAELMDCDLPIEPKDTSVPYTSIEYPKLPEATSEQKMFVNGICNTYHLSIKDSTMIDYILCRQIEQFNKQMHQKGIV